MVNKVCPECNGYGKVYDSLSKKVDYPCPECKGEGYIPPAPEKLREEVARYIAIIRGLVSWDNLPRYQTKECGCACQEACFRETDHILSLLQSAQAEAVRQERKRIISALGAYENDMGFVEISNHVPWQAFSNEGKQIEKGE